MYGVLVDNAKKKKKKGLEAISWFISCQFFTQFICCISQWIHFIGQFVSIGRWFEIVALVPRSCKTHCKGRGKRDLVGKWFAISNVQLGCNTKEVDKHWTVLCTGRKLSNWIRLLIYRNSATWQKRATNWNFQWVQELSWGWKTLKGRRESLNEPENIWSKNSLTKKKRQFIL